MSSQIRSLHEQSNKLEGRILAQGLHSGATLIDRWTLIEEQRENSLFRASAVAFRGSVTSLYNFLESLYHLNLPFHIEEPHLSRDGTDQNSTNLTFILTTNAEVHQAA